MIQISDLTGEVTVKKIQQVAGSDNSYAVCLPSSSKAHTDQNLSAQLYVWFHTPFLGKKEHIAALWATDSHKLKIIILKLNIFYQ